MLKGMILATAANAATFEANSIGDVLAQWEAAGFFTYLIPFLIIFALTYGILHRMKIFPKKKGVSAIIALAVGLMALQFPMVPEFFRELFPRLGVGLGIILVMLVALGMFMKSDNALPYLVGFLVFIVVIVKTSGALGWGGNFAYWDDHWPLIIGVVFIIVVMSIVVSPDKEDKKKSVLERMLETADKD